MTVRDALWQAQQSGTVECPDCSSDNLMLTEDYAQLVIIDCKDCNARFGIKTQ